MVIDRVEPDRRTPGVGKVLSGLSWTGASFVVQGVAQLAVLAVLGRLLTPRDFGILTATLVVVNLGRLCTMGVISAAIVQRPDLTEDHVRAGFWLSMGVGLLAVALMVGAAGPMAAFFDMPALAGVMRTLTLVFVIQAFATVPLGLLERDLRFRTVAMCEIAAHGIGYAVVGILSGYLGSGIWALVHAHIGLAAVQTGSLLASRRHSVSHRLDRRAMRELAAFSGGLLGGKFFNYLALQGDNLVVARMLSASALGAYGRAYQLISFPAMFVGQILDRTLLPVFARLQHDPVRLGRAYVRGLALVVTLMAPASVVLLIAADDVVRTVLGGGWDEVVVPLQIFAVGLVARTAYKISDTLTRATGVVYARAGRQLLYAALVAIGSVVGQRWGIEGVAIGVTIAITANHLAMLQLARRAVALRWAPIVSAHLRPLSGVVAMTAAAVLVRSALVSAAAPALVVVLAVTVAAGTTFVAQLRFLPRLSGADDVRWFVREARAWGHR